MTEDVTISNAAAVGLGPSMSMSLVYTAMSDSIAMVMHNATSDEQNTQFITSAATVQVCALIIAKGCLSEE